MSFKTPEPTTGYGYVWRGGVPTVVKYERGFSQMDGFPYCYEINSGTNLAIPSPVPLEPHVSIDALVKHKENRLKRELRSFLNQAIPKMEEYNRIQQFKAESERHSIAEPRDLISLDEGRKVAEIDAAGSALTRGLLERVEDMLRPLAQLFQNCDVLLRRVSVSHLNEAYKDHQLAGAVRHHQRFRTIIKDRANGHIEKTSPWYFTENFELEVKYEDDTSEKQ